MKSLIGSIVAVVLLFLLVLVALGTNFGDLEIVVWFVALVASLFFVVRHHRRGRSEGDSGSSLV
ncbi:hypothetical protein ABZ990_11800 [Streptomyces sp. NPDC046203]|uniref:hypothetical protein n=1 Tax=Streptomyces sp. NPDC046203 TaxID=3154602 RepID=UPI00340B2579